MATQNMMKYIIKFVEMAKEYFLNSLEESNRRIYDYSTALVSELDQKINVQLNSINLRFIEEFQKFKNINKNTYNELNDVGNHINKNVYGDFERMKM